MHQGKTEPTAAPLFFPYHARRQQQMPSESRLNMGGQACESCWQHHSVLLRGCRFSALFWRWEKGVTLYAKIGDTPHEGTTRHNIMLAKGKNSPT